MPRKGGKRTKSRTHEAPVPQGAVTLDQDNKPIAISDSLVPRSIVARASKLQGPVKVLVTDLRRLMEPYTASKLKERGYNRLKDYVSVAGMLDISHIMTLSQTENRNVVLKIARNPSGPTLSFKVQKYSLSGQVKSIQKRPYDSARLFTTPPVVVLNNFGQSSESHIQVMKVMFQNMLPTIDVKTVKLNDCRRVVLFHYRKEDGLVEMRHYAIRANPVGISRSAKKLLQGKIPDLSQLQDVSEFMEGHGLDAASDSEAEDEESKVYLPQKFAGKGNNESQQSAMKLSELGPRMTLELFKVESGVGEGDVVYHKFVHKTPQEAAELKKRIDGEKMLKEQRRNQQNENVKRKREAEEQKKREKIERKRLKYEARATEAKNSNENNEDDDNDDDNDHEEGDYDNSEGDEEYGDDEEEYDDEEYDQEDV